MPNSKRLRYDPNNDLYIVLGISANATTVEVQRAFRQRAKEVHPDLNPERLDWANAQFRRLNEAYDVLGDVTLRADYDRLRGPYQAGGSTYNTRPRQTEWQASPSGTTRTTRPSSRPTAASRAAWARHGYIRPMNSRSLAYVRWVLGRIFSGPYRRILAILVVVVIVNVVFVLMFAPFFSAASQRIMQPMYFTQNVAAANTTDLPSSCDAAAGVNVQEPANDTTLNDQTFSITASVPTGVIRTSEIDLLPLDSQPDVIATLRWNLVSVDGQTPIIENGQLQTLTSLSGIPEGDYSLRVAVTREDGTLVGPCALTIHHRR